MRRDVRGLIVHYREGRGIVLLQSREHPHFRVLCRSYLRGELQQRPRLVRFTLGALNEQDCAQLLAGLSRKANCRGRLAGAGRLLIGRVVLCTVVWTPDGRIVKDLRLDPYHPKRLGTVKRLKRVFDEYPWNEHRVLPHSDRRIERRDYALNLRRPNNLRHPFRG